MEGPLDTRLIQQVEEAYARGWHGRDVDAIPELHRLAARCREAGNVRLAAKVALASSRLHRILGDHAGAVAALDQAMADERRLPLDERVLLLNYRGCCLVDAGDLGGSIGPVLRAWELAQEVAPASAGIAATNLAMVLIDLGDVVGAEIWLARASWPGQAAFSKAHVTFARALLAQRRGRPEGLNEPVDALARMVEAFDGDAGDHVRITGLLDLATAWKALAEDRPEAALGHLAAAEASFTRDGNRSDVGEICLASAQAHAALDQLDDADRCVRRGLAAATDPSLRRLLYRLGGELALQQGRPTDAAERYRLASEQDPEQRAQLGAALRKAAETASAAGHDADLLVRHEALARAHQALEARHTALERQVKERTDALNREVHHRQEALRRFERSERSRARALEVLLDALTEPPEGGDGPPERTRRLRSRLRTAMAVPSSSGPFDLGRALEARAQRRGLPIHGAFDRPVRTRRTEVLPLVDSLLDHADAHGTPTGLHLRGGDGTITLVVHRTGPPAVDGEALGAARVLVAALGGELEVTGAGGSELRVALPHHALCAPP